jgi:hypothetical protein
MVHTLGSWGMGDSDRRTSQYARVAHLNGKYGTAFDDVHDDLLDTEFHGETQNKGGYGSDHDEMLHEGFGRETEEEDVQGGNYDGAALSEEGYGSHKEESFLQTPPIVPEREIDLHPLNNQVAITIGFPPRNSVLICRHPQVGGHTRLLVLNDSTVIKPLNVRELHFYQNIPREIEMFVPKYKGKIGLSRSRGVSAFLRFSRDRASLACLAHYHITR